MKATPISETKRYFHRLLRKAAAGEDVYIKRGRVTVAKLVAFESDEQRTLGRDVGTFTVPADFNALTAEGAGNSTRTSSSAASGEASDG